jgi:glycosyltransferase involved in cell wall biosynthesis
MTDGASRKRVVVHDYAGHPFQIQLSRELARRGYTVAHQFSSTHTGGRGRLTVTPDDPPTLSVTDVRLSAGFAQYSWTRRTLQELEYGVRAFLAVRRADPDITITCNVPLLANAVLALLLRITRRPYVFWHQDVQSSAIASRVRGRWGPVGALIRTVTQAVERQIARWAAHRVVITDAFLPVHARWGVPRDGVSVIPNWAPLEELPEVRGDRSWLGDRRVAEHLLLYSGTLGLKHDPAVLLHLAGSPLLSDCTVVVVSQGKGRAWLEERADTVPPGRLLLLDYVDYALLPRVLGSADVLLAVLEHDASRYSVPSKVLSYLCAGRPVVGVMDRANAVAATLVEQGAGLVQDIGNHEQLAQRIRQLLDDPGRAAQMGAAARRYAEETFDIARIGDAFEALVQGRRPRAGSPPDVRRRESTWPLRA